MTYLISASLANLASGIFVIPITSQFQLLNNKDSAYVENCGPSIAIYVPPSLSFKVFSFIY